MHRTNPAERALKTYKSCMKSTTASLPPTSLISLWCRLLPQVDISVNIVRKCRQNPLMFAWTAMEGEYHFDSTPIAPPGTEILMHKKPGRRQNFGYNAKKSWYISPCLRHYCTFKVRREDIRTPSNQCPDSEDEVIYDAPDTDSTYHHAVCHCPGKYSHTETHRNWQCSLRLNARLRHSIHL